MPVSGDGLPGRPADYAAVVMVGGPMSANDCSIDGIRAEFGFLPKVLEAKVQCLGLCLGRQTLARVLGGKAGPYADGQVKTGFTRIYPTELGRDWFVEPDVFCQWHREGVIAPEMAKVLATGDVYPARPPSTGKML